MLVLSRKPGEKIIINGNIEVTFMGFKGQCASIGVQAPPEIPVLRGELAPFTKQPGRTATPTSRRQKRHRRAN